MEFPLRGRDEKFRWFLTCAVPVKREEGLISGWIGSSRDIDDPGQSIDPLKTKKRLREQFVSTLTHDLRSLFVFQVDLSTA